MSSEYDVQSTRGIGGGFSYYVVVITQPVIVDDVGLHISMKKNRRRIKVRKLRNESVNLSFQEKLNTKLREPEPVQ